MSRLWRTNTQTVESRAVFSLSWIRNINGKDEASSKGVWPTWTSLACSTKKWFCLSKVLTRVEAHESVITMMMNMITAIYRKRCVPWGGWLVISMNFPFLVEAKTSSCCISICLFQSSTSALNWSNTNSSIASLSDILQCNVNFGLVSRQRCRSIHRHSFTAKRGGQLEANCLCKK